MTEKKYFWLLAAVLIGLGLVSSAEALPRPTTLNFSVAAEDISPFGIYKNVSHFMLMGSNNDNVYLYNLSGTYTGQFFSIGSMTTGPTGLAGNGTHYVITELNAAWVTDLSFNELMRWTTQYPNCNGNCNDIRDLGWNGSDWLVNYQNSVRPHIVSLNTTGNFSGLSVNVSNLGRITSLGVSNKSLNLFVTVDPDPPTRLSNLYKLNHTAGLVEGINLTFDGDNVVAMDYDGSNLYIVESDEDLVYEFHDQKVNFFVRDETTDNVFGTADDTFNSTVTLQIINRKNDTTKENIEIKFSQGNTTINNLSINNLSGDSYAFRYSAPGYGENSYFFTLPQSADLTINAYLLNSTGATQVVMTTVDQNDNVLNGSIVKVLRYYFKDRQYNTVAMGETDFNGETPINLILNTQNYRFVVERNGQTIYTTSDAKITKTTVSIQAIIGQGTLQLVKNLDNTLTSLSSTATGVNNVTYNYTFANSDNSVAGGCLLVTKTTAKGESQLCNLCATGTDNFLTCNINESSGTITAEGFINTTTELVTTNIDVRSFQQQIFGTAGAFISIILVFAIIAVGLFSTTAALIMGVVGLAVTAALGLYTISLGAVVAMIGAAVILIIRSERT